MCWEHDSKPAIPTAMKGKTANHRGTNSCWTFFPGRTKVAISSIHVRCQRMSDSNFYLSWSTFDLPLVRLTCSWRLHEHCRKKYSTVSVGMFMYSFRRVLVWCTVSLASVDATADNTNAATQNGIEEHYPSFFRNMSNKNCEISTSININNYHQSTSTNTTKSTNINQHQPTTMGLLTNDRESAQVHPLKRQPPRLRPPRWRRARQRPRHRRRRPKQLWLGWEMVGEWDGLSAINVGNTIINHPHILHKFVV
jgi:hypothetical protein